MAHRPSYLDGGAVADRLGSRLTIYGSGSLGRTAGRCPNLPPLLTDPREAPVTGGAVVDPALETILQ